MNEKLGTEYATIWFVFKIGTGRNSARKQVPKGYLSYEMAEQERKACEKFSNCAAVIRAADFSIPFIEKAADNE